MFFKGEVEAEVRETQCLRGRRFHFESDFEKVMKETEGNSRVA